MHAGQTVNDDLAIILISCVAHGFNINNLKRSIKKYKLI